MSGMRIDPRYVARHFVVAEPVYTHKIVRLGNQSTNLVVKNLDSNELTYLDTHLRPPFRVIQLFWQMDGFTATRVSDSQQVMCQVTDVGGLEISEQGAMWRSLLGFSEARLYIPIAG